MPRDPRLAAKLASTAATPNLDKSSGKPPFPNSVNLEKSLKPKNNHLIDSSNKSSVNNKINLPNTASLNSNNKDPRLISSKVHQPQTINSVPLSNDEYIADAQNSGSVNKGKLGSIRLKTKSVTKKGASRGSSKIDSENSKSKVSRSESKSRSSSRSPTKPVKRKDSPRKKSYTHATSSVEPVPESPTKRTEKRKIQKSTYHPTAIVKIPPSPPSITKYDADMDICNSPSPSPIDEPKLSNKSNDDVKSFKDLKGSTKSRNYMRRNRVSSRSPDLLIQPQPVVSTTVLDVDLRVCGPPPEKVSRKHSPTPPPPVVSTTTLKEDESVDKNSDDGTSRFTDSNSKYLLKLYAIIPFHL